MKKIILSLLTILCLFSFSLPTASASTLANPRYNRRTVDGPWDTHPTADGGNVYAIQQVQNGRNITYSINPNMKNVYLVKRAINIWNNLGVVNLVQVPWSDNSSQIKIRNNNGSYKENKYVLGYEAENFYTDRPQWIIDCTVNICDTAANKPKVQQLITDVHELGHALGFKHDSRMMYTKAKQFPGKEYRHARKFPLTMNPINYRYMALPGRIEQQTLSDHYHLEPDNGWMINNW